MSETIALFGATGDTGSEILKIALKQGYRIQALARTPSKITVTDANLSIIQGDFEDVDAIKAVVRGASYVIVCAGGNIKAKPYVPLMENFVTQQLWPAMIAEPSIKVFLYQAGAAAAEPGKSVPFAMRAMKVVADCFISLSAMVADNEGVIQFVHSQKQKPFKVIFTRPGGIKKGEPSDKGCVAAESPPMGMISFADLASFTLKAIKDPSLFGKYPYVRNGWAIWG